MISFRRNHVRTQPINDYAGVDDFFSVFTDCMDQLYQLSFLLTADHQKAKRCFVAGLDESVTSNRVFREWARSWAKRAIIQNAIREVKPHSSLSNLYAFAVSDYVVEVPGGERHFTLNSILALPDFERFVFVMSVLERYSDHDCAILLGCTGQEIREARVRSYSRLANTLRIVPPHKITDAPLASRRFS